MPVVLKPFDVVVIDGEWYMPHHWLIRWRGLNKGVHCVTLMNELGEIWNPTFVGIKGGLSDGAMGHLNYYKGRSITIHRYKGDLDYAKMVSWGKKTEVISRGYDFFRQWLLGFVLGITTKALADDNNRWTCAEFPYWGFQENGYPLTSIEETLPLPRHFRFNDHFETVFKGVWP